MALDRTKKLCLYSILLYANNVYHVEFIKDLPNDSIVEITENNFRTREEMMTAYSLTDYDYLLQVEIL